MRVIVRPQKTARGIVSDVKGILSRSPQASAFEPARALELWDQAAADLKQVEEIVGRATEAMQKAADTLELVPKRGYYTPEENEELDEQAEGAKIELKRVLREL